MLVFSVWLGGCGVVEPALAAQPPAAQNQDRIAAAGLSTAPEKAAPEKVDLNHATRQQLLTLPGITAIWAGRIEAGRPFASKTQLLTRGVVPRNLYLGIQDRVVAHREKQ